MHIFMFVIGLAAFVMTNLGLMVALALWTYEDAKTRSNESPVLWLLVVLLANIVGLIVYLCVRDKTKKGSGKYKKLAIGFAVALIPAIAIYVIGLVMFIVVQTVEVITVSEVLM